jgi:hypothetical protein
MEGLVSNPGASRWVVTSPGPGLVRHNVKSAKRQQLLQEAASMTPDSAQLFETLGLNDLAPQDSYLYGASLNEHLNDYMTKYRDNPYYAFSREGVQKVRDMQQLVRDPRINAVKQAYKSTQDVYKKKSEEGLGNYAVVKGGNMLIVDDEGNLREISPDHLDAKKHFVPTYEQAYNYLTSKKGFHNVKLQDIRPLNNDMANPSEVIEQVNKWFQGLGQVQQEAFRGDLQGLITEKRTSNSGQIRSRLNAILSSTGLPNNYRDTIYSQYYTNELAQGRKPTREGAERALYETIGRIAEGHDVFKQDFQANPVYTGAAARKEALIETSPWLAAASGEQSADHPLTIQNNTSGRWGVLNYRPIPTTYLEKSTGAFKDDANLTQPKKNVKDLSVFRTASTEDMYIPDLNNAGKLVKVPAEVKSLLGEIVVDPGFLADAPIKFDEKGEAYVHGAANDVPETNSARTFIVNAKIQGNRDVFSDATRYQQMMKFFDDHGYSTREASDSELEEYIQNVNDPDYKKGSNPYNPFYEFKIFTKYNPDAMKSLDDLPVGFESKGRTTLEFMTATQSANNPQEGNPFNGKARFPGFNDF